MLPTPLTGSSIACSPRHIMASGGAGTGWMWLVMPTRRATSLPRIVTIRSPTPTVITSSDALNADLPYDQFIVQQLAADQLPRGDDPGPLAAMGFLTVGRRFLLDQNEIIDDRIDVVSRGLLGLTVTCARCHDHKFDPIPSEDYYSLYGVFASSVEPAELPLLEKIGSSPGYADFERKLNAAKKARDDYLAARRDEFVSEVSTRFSAYLKAAYDLDLNGRNRRLDERAGADKLNARRLRTLIGLWKGAFAAVLKEADPVLGPWRVFAALPQNEFAARAKDLQRDLTQPKDPKAAPVHPLVARAVLGSPPASKGEVVARYLALFAELETRLKDQKGRPAGVAFGRARVGVAAPGSVRPDRSAGDLGGEGTDISGSEPAGAARSVERGDRETERHSPGGAGAGHGHERCPAAL